MSVMLLVLFVCSANFAIGFALATHLGHGPPSLGIPGLDKLKERLQSLAKPRGKSQDAAH